MDGDTNEPSAYSLRVNFLSSSLINLRALESHNLLWIHLNLFFCTNIVFSFDPP
jgi:hypothetical protein